LTLLHSHFLLLLYLWLRLSPLLPAEFIKVAFDFGASFAHMPQYTNLHIAVTGVHAIHNHALAQAFAAAKAARAKVKGDVTEATVYHGTHPDNISKIALNNISMKHKGKLDPGWFGAGLYFSKFADVSARSGTAPPQPAFPAPQYSSLAHPSPLCIPARLCLCLHLCACC